MPYYRSRSRYGRQSGRSSQRMVTRPGGQLTNRFKSKVKSVVTTHVPIQQRTVSRTPPQFTKDKKWRRVIRITPAAAALSVTYTQLLSIEAGYYGSGAGSNRWQSIKVLGFKAYGTAGGILNITVLGQTNATGTTSFEDYGDGCERSCISVQMPVDSRAQTGVSGDPIVTFEAGLCQCIDFYVELG